MLQASSDTANLTFQHPGSGPSKKLRTCTTVPCASTMHCTQAAYALQGSLTRTPPVLICLLAVFVSPDRAVFDHIPHGRHAFHLTAGVFPCKGQGVWHSKASETARVSTLVIAPSIDTHPTYILTVCSQRGVHKTRHSQVSWKAWRHSQLAAMLSSGHFVHSRGVMAHLYCLKAQCTLPVFSSSLALLRL